MWILKSEVFFFIYFFSHCSCHFLSCHCLRSDCGGRTRGNLWRAAVTSGGQGHAEWWWAEAEGRAEAEEIIDTCKTVEVNSQTLSSWWPKEQKIEEKPDDEMIKGGKPHPMLDTHCTRYYSGCAVAYRYYMQTVVQAFEHLFIIVIEWKLRFCHWDLLQTISF